MRRGVKFRVRLRLRERNRKQTPQVQFIVRGKPQRAEHPRLSGLQVVVLIGEVVPGRVDQVVYQRGSEIEWA